MSILYAFYFERVRRVVSQKKTSYPGEEPRASARPVPRGLQARDSLVEKRVKRGTGSYGVRYLPEFTQERIDDRIIASQSFN